MQVKLYYSHQQLMGTAGLCAAIHAAQKRKHKQRESIGGLAGRGGSTLGGDRSSRHDGRGQGLGSTRLDSASMISKFSDAPRATSFLGGVGGGVSTTGSMARSPRSRGAAPSRSRGQVQSESFLFQDEALDIGPKQTKAVSFSTHDAAATASAAPIVVGAGPGVGGAVEGPRDQKATIEGLEVMSRAITSCAESFEGGTEFRLQGLSDPDIFFGKVRCNASCLCSLSWSLLYWVSGIKCML